jgi:hypothetical protein
MRYDSPIVRHLLRVLFLAGLAWIAPLALAGTLSISGRVIAYSGPITCENGNAYWSMIIRVQDPSKVGSELIEVKFSQPCEKSPTWLHSKSTVQRFKLIRYKEGDEVLTEFLNCESEASEPHAQKPCPSIPIWRRLHGAEEDRLPFGLKLPCYRSADLPLVPSM